jgi:hypothetical protein
MSLMHGLPLGVMTDSYKATHFYLYPDATKVTGHRGGVDAVRCGIILIQNGIGAVRWWPMESFGAALRKILQTLV